MLTDQVVFHRPGIWGRQLHEVNTARAEKASRMRVFTPFDDNKVVQWTLINYCESSSTNHNWKALVPAHAAVGPPLECKFFNRHQNSGDISTTWTTTTDTESHDNISSYWWDSGGDWSDFVWTADDDYDKVLIHNASIDGGAMDFRLSGNGTLVTTSLTSSSPGSGDGVWAGCQVGRYLLLATNVAAGDTIEVKSPSSTGRIYELVGVTSRTSCPSTEGVDHIVLSPQMFYTDVSSGTWHNSDSYDVIPWFTGRAPGRSELIAFADGAGGAGLDWGSPQHTADGAAEQATEGIGGAVNAHPSGPTYKVYYKEDDEDTVEVNFTAAAGGGCEPGDKIVARSMNVDVDGYVYVKAFSGNIGTYHQQLSLTPSGFQNYWRIEFNANAASEDVFVIGGEQAAYAYEYMCHWQVGVGDVSVWSPGGDWKFAATSLGDTLEMPSGYSGGSSLTSRSSDVFVWGDDPFGDAALHISHMATPMFAGGSMLMNDWSGTENGYGKIYYRGKQIPSGNGWDVADGDIYDGGAQWSIFPRAKLDAMQPTVSVNLSATVEQSSFTSSKETTQIQSDSHIQNQDLSDTTITYIPQGALVTFTSNVDVLGYRMRTVVMPSDQWDFQISPGDVSTNIPVCTTRTIQLLASSFKKRTGYYLDVLTDTGWHSHKWMRVS